MARPHKFLSGLESCFGPWSTHNDFSALNESLCEYRERVLTEAEQRVARPLEISNAQNLGQLDEMQVIWAQRLAERNNAAEATKIKLAELQAGAKPQGTAAAVAPAPTCRPPNPSQVVNKLPAETEMYHFCNCSAYYNKCRYCNDSAVLESVHQNLI